MLGGCTVCEIARSAFLDRSNLTSITIAPGASFTNIGPNWIAYPNRFWRVVSTRIALAGKSGVSAARHGSGPSMNS